MTQESGRSRDTLAKAPAHHVQRAQRRHCHAFARVWLRCRIVRSSQHGDETSNRGRTVIAELRGLLRHMTHCLLGQDAKG